MIGFTSSRSEFRTKAYTDLILSVDGNVFSSWLRSLNLTRMVVCRASSRRILRREGDHAHEATVLASPCPLHLVSPVSSAVHSPGLGCAQTATPVGRGDPLCSAGSTNPGGPLGTERVHGESHGRGQLCTPTYCAQYRLAEGGSSGRMAAGCHPAYCCQ